LTRARWKKFPARKHFRKTSRRGIFQKKTIYNYVKGEAASEKKKSWRLYAAHLLEVRRETEGIEPERRHQSYVTVQ
jgi:hypothetical protein